MRFKSIIVGASTLGFAAVLMSGCNDGYTPQMIQAPPVEPAKETPLPKDKTKGGGPASSGNMKRHPGDPS